MRAPTERWSRGRPSAWSSGALVVGGIIDMAVFSTDDTPRVKRASPTFGVAPIVGRHEVGLSIAGSF
jgi:hypothetical protein